MKKILLPTDFSENAKASASYAAQLADLLNVQIDIAHVSDMVSPTGLYEAAHDLAYDNIRKKLHDLALSMERETEGDLQFETFLLSGSTTGALASILDQYDLVVMSAKGQVDMDRIFLGSTTKYLIQRNVCPVIVVPPEFQFKPLKTIIWALDDHAISTSKQIQPLPELARQFNAKIEIFHQDQGKHDRGLALDLAIFLEDLEYSVHYNFEADNITDAILDFAEDEKADLVVMIHHPRHILLQLIHPSKTLTSVFRTSVPLLILPEREA